MPGEVNSEMAGGWVLNQRPPASRIARIQPTLRVGNLLHHGCRCQFPILPAYLALEISSDPNLLDSRKTAANVLAGILDVVGKEEFEFNLIILIDNRAESLVHDRP
jgi:hypothetical protein